MLHRDFQTLGRGLERLGRGFEALSKNEKLTREFKKLGPVFVLQHGPRCLNKPR